MKICRSIDQFIRNYDTEVSKIILKKFRNVIKYQSLEDVKSNLYMRLFEKHYIENYRPFNIYVDVDKDTWQVELTAAKFSTYIYSLLKNCLCSYYNKNKIDGNNKCISLDIYDDSCHSRVDRKKIKLESQYMLDFDTQIYLAKIDEYLKNATGKRGRFVELREDPYKLLKMIDKCGEAGCSDKDILKKLGSSYDKLSAIEKEGLIRSVTGEDGNKKYFLNNIKRRSVHQVFRYYVNGYKDKEISEELKITIAGVGMLKKALRKHIRKFTETVEN